MDIELITELLSEPSLAPRITEFVDRVKYEYNLESWRGTDSPSAIELLRKFVDEYKYVDSPQAKQLPFAKRMVLATALKTLHNQLVQETHNEKPA